MTTLDLSDIPPDDIVRVLKKLDTMRETLSPPEQQFLDNIFHYIKAQRYREPEVQDLVQEVPDSPELLDDVAGFMVQNADIECGYTTMPSVLNSLRSAIIPWVGCDCI